MQCGGRAWTPLWRGCGVGEGKHMEQPLCLRLVAPEPVLASSRCSAQTGLSDLWWLCFGKSSVGLSQVDTIHGDTSEAVAPGASLPPMGLFLWGC